MVVGMAIVAVAIATWPEKKPEPVAVEGPTLEMAAQIGTQCMAEAAVRVQVTKDEKPWNQVTRADSLEDCMTTCRNLSEWGDRVKANERSCALAAQQSYLEGAGNGDL